MSAALASTAEAPKAENRGSGETLTPPEKAAIIITALPPEEASDLLRKLGPAHVRSYASATQRLRHIPTKVLEQVIIEFLDSLGNTDVVVGPDTAREILSRIMDADAVDGIMGDISGKRRTVWDRIRDTSDETIAAFIEEQHPRAASIVMGRLAPKQAAGIIDLLKPETAERVIAMLETPSVVQPRILEMLEGSLEEELLGTTKKGDPPDIFVGAVFDNLKESARDPLMKRLEEKTPEFARAVAKQMFLFDDIPARLEVKDVPILSRELDQAVLSVALGYAASRGSEAGEYILAGMPKRMAEQIRDAIEDAGAPNDEEGQAAEAEVIQFIRRLADTAEIKLKST